MAFKKAQRITLSDLDAATKEYEALLKKAEKTYRNYIYFYNHQRIQLKTGVAPLTLRHSA